MSVGPIAGLLAGKVMKSGYVLIGDIVLGILGAILGAYLTGSFSDGTGQRVQPRSVVVASVGAVILTISQALTRRRVRSEGEHPYG
jgi:uncharacterized membrane protein YeaQ/YmgE (transglycosylase-associated protein family)